MKQQFNNSGVAKVQSRILALPETLLKNETSAIRQDFLAWMETNFALTTSQKFQLMTMPDELQTNLGLAIANCYEMGQAVQFFKETRSDHDKPDLKDIMIHGAETMAEIDSISMQKTAFVGQLAINIRYKVRM
ncbi:hypothetical protein AB3466_16015 [Sphingobacterium thalpophilum]|uniref:hypothetical protein n=1 Tax=Sphingobacterium thalpophilum TaxID=259 RepID=UPI0037DA4032